MSHLPISQDVYLELPTEPVLQSLGTNYNALVRTWTLRQYQLHLEHHQKMVHYYQQCIKRVEELEIKYEREPEQIPVASVGAGGPIKLSDLAKLKPQQSVQPLRSPQQSTQPLRSPTPAQSPQPSGPAANIKSFDGGKSNTLSSSLAAKDVKLDKKPKPMTVDVQLDADELDALTQPELEHFSRPQPKRKNNKRTDMPKLDDHLEEDEVSTWQETPNAFGDKKESKFKSTFGNLKSSLFSKDEKEKEKEKEPTQKEPTQASSATNNHISVSTNYPSSPTSYPPPPSAPSTPSYGGSGGVPPVYNPTTNYSSFNSPSNSSNSPPPPMPTTLPPVPALPSSAPPPMPGSGPPMPGSGPPMPTSGPPKMPSGPPPLSGKAPPPPPPTP